MPRTAIGSFGDCLWDDRTDHERRGSALPVTRTRPRTTTGEREILGDEIAGRDEKGAWYSYCN